MSALFRRRNVWVPTVWGTGLLLVVFAAGFFAAGLAMPRFLAPQAPAFDKNGQGARTLVVEGWLDESELAQAVKLIEHSQYTRVFTSGGPIAAETDAGGWHNYAMRAAAYLKLHLPPTLPVTPVPAPYTRRDRTYLSAAMVRDRLKQEGGVPEAVDFLSAGVHGRRSRVVYRLAFGPQVDIGILSADSGEFDSNRWWTTSEGTKGVLGEVFSLGWTYCCFWPGKPE